MDTMIQKSYYHFLCDFVRTHLDLLQQSKVFIFGAGVRGRNLLCILKQFGVTNIAFVDNNPQKQGIQVDTHMVFSFSDAMSCTGARIFLCPVEKNQAIIKQLNLEGLKRDIDYFELDFPLNDYLDVIEEIKRPGIGYSLAFGNCTFSSCILGDKFSPSFGELIKDQLFEKNCGKVCSLPGLSTGIYYYVIDTMQSLYGQSHIKLIFLTLEISCFSPYTPLLLGSQNYLQHKLFLEQLVNLAPSQTDIIKYLSVIDQRYRKSLIMPSLVKSFEFESAIKQVYQLKYNFEIDENNESVVYTKKILERLNKEGIPVILYFPPIDYKLGEQICGANFTAKYTLIVDKIKSFLTGYTFEYIDASTIMQSDCFVQQMTTPDINPWLNEKGQRRAINFLKNHDSIRLLVGGKAK